MLGMQVQGRIGTVHGARRRWMPAGIVRMRRIGVAAVTQGKALLLLQLVLRFVAGKSMGLLLHFVHTNDLLLGLEEALAVLEKPLNGRPHNR